MSFLDRSEAYLDELARLFRFLSRDGSVQNKYPSIANSANENFEIVQQARRFRDRPATISIAPNWQIPINSEDVCSAPGEATLFIGGEIIFSERCLKRQCITAVITFRTSENSVSNTHDLPLIPGTTYMVRRIHYDFDLDLTNKDRPIQHLQIGGKLDPGYLYEAGSLPNPFEHEIFKQLDLPRIPYPITDLASLMEMLLNQFNKDRATFLEESGWIDRVCSMEKIWLKHYYEQALQLINRVERKETLYTYQCAPIDD